MQFKHVQNDQSTNEYEMQFNICICCDSFLEMQPPKSALKQPFNTSSKLSFTMKFVNNFQFQNYFYCRSFWDSKHNINSTQNLTFQISENTECNSNGNFKVSTNPGIDLTAAG